MCKTLSNSKKILVAPLDWGLGHASRCIPVIQTCLDLGHQVVLAGEGPSLLLLREAFPSLNVLQLKGYRVQYAASSNMLPLKILSQLPRLLLTIRSEHRWLKQAIAQHQFDLVISDNRYGLFHSRVPCFFMTHQLQIRIPQSGLLQKMVNRVNHWFIRKFTACLVPDYPGEHNMAGELSGPDGLTSAYYLGNLSRFSDPLQTAHKYDLLVLLSGPEPQRTLLEQIIRTQAAALPVKTRMVLGKPGKVDHNSEETNLKISSHLPAKELQEIILQSKLVIARPGYSTVMDLIKLNKHAVLIPTPGQTEQEYLGAYLSEKKWFGLGQQKNLSLTAILQQYGHSPFKPFPQQDMYRYRAVLKEVLEQYT